MPRQRGHRAIEQRLAHRRGTERDAPQRRQIVRADRRMIDQHLDHRRHQQDLVHPVALDRLHHAFRAEGADHHIGAAAQHQRVHRGTVRQVEHRRRMQIDRIAGEQPLGQHVECVGHQVAVAQHHALGAAGGTAGIEDAGEVVRPPHRVRHRRRRFQQRLVARRTCRRRAIIGMDQPQRSHALRELASELGERVIHHQRHRAAVAQRILDLRRAPADVHRHDHGAGPGDGKIQFQIAILVQHQHADAIAGADTHRP